ncbi:response regulator [Cohnella rhizosphaerae]|uniref:Response regulator n=1 Tax=Cohnella rhizosphaerae TaxID=1457232 RepID=A0A9X4KZC8_9BACL|nr:response regulator [Cohnella rhizosphaerae]MDG0814035.1 response regulator [Cohnella rhizosphaerae]
MFRILIVDDEPFERDGVVYLIRKFGLDLSIAEAESGEEALAYMQAHAVDILLTDIRMTGMDGLQLARHARDLQPNVKIVILSAYGQFEYAQQAIDLKAVQYVLKPVEVESFVKALRQVVDLCAEERLELERQSKLQQVYRRGIQSEKITLLADLMGEGENRPLSGEDDRGELLRLNRLFAGPGVSEDRAYRFLMLDTRMRFFDTVDAGFEALLGERLDSEGSVMVLNEYQALVLLEARTGETERSLARMCEDLARWFKGLYGKELSIVCSGAFQDFAQMRAEYRKLESMLESKFFYEEGFVLFADAALPQLQSSAFAERAIADISQCLSRKEWDVAQIRFVQLFDDLKKGGHFSVIYVKYICSEIIRSLLQTMRKGDSDDFRGTLEAIFRTTALKELRQLMLDLFRECGARAEPAAPPEANHKIVDEVIQIIEREYHTDLSVDTIAERVYLTPSYLSHLFAKQTGVSLIKYLTMHRLEKARQLLKETNRKIVDIGAEVGYANYPYFCSLLKNYYGKTPTQIREEGRT